MGFYTHMKLDVVQLTLSELLTIRTVQIFSECVNLFNEQDFAHCFEISFTVFFRLAILDNREVCQLHVTDS